MAKLVKMAGLGNFERRARLSQEAIEMELEEEEKDTMPDYLPQEVLIEILTRIPIDSLIRSRLVSKSWNSLITSPLFIAAHLNHRLAHNHPSLLVRRCLHHRKSQYYSLSPEDSSLDHCSELELPCESFNKCFNVVGSCNGVVCLLDDHGSYTCNLILWNPSIRKALKLTPPAFSCHVAGPYLAVVGFGFDSRVNDYKVVRLVNLWKMKKKSQGRNLKRPVKVEVYSTNAASWKTLDVSLQPLRMHFGKWAQAFINGVVHWLACREVSGKDRVFVLTFDLSNECFGEIMLPESLASGTIGDMSVSVFQQSLAVLVFHPRSCDVWVMEAYGVGESWTTQTSVNVGFLTGSATFRKDGEILMTRFGEAVSYHPQKKEINQLRIYGEHCFYASCFVESLGLLNASSDIKLDEKLSRKRKASLMGRAKNPVDFTGPSSDDLEELENSIQEVKEQHVQVVRLRQDQLNRQADQLKKVADRIEREADQIKRQVFEAAQNEITAFPNLPQQPDHQNQMNSQMDQMARQVSESVKAVLQSSCLLNASSDAKLAETPSMKRKLSPVEPANKISGCAGSSSHSGGSSSSLLTVRALQNAVRDLKEQLVQDFSSLGDQVDRLVEQITRQRDQMLALVIEAIKDAFGVNSGQRDQMLALVFEAVKNAVVPLWSLPPQADQQDLKNAVLALRNSPRQADQ